MSAKKLESFLHEQIPLTKSLGIKVKSANEEEVKLWAPLAPNRNHLGSAFGGSLSAVLILSGYTWLYNFLALNGFQSHVIIKSGKTDYLLPVTKDMLIQSSAPSAAEREKFLNSFKRRGVARIFIEAEIIFDGAQACTFRGEFVAKQSESGRLG